MREVTQYELTDTERQLLKDYYLPLHHLCKDVDRAFQAARLVRGNADNYSREQALTIALAVTDLYDVVWCQASVSYWQDLGMSEPKGLAEMRNNEALRLYELLSSLTGTTTKVA